MQHTTRQVGEAILYIHIAICNMLYTYVYMYITCTFISVTAMTEYGWRRENGKLEIDWEVQENIEKAKMSLDFVLKGCKCKTGCKTRI